MLRNGLEPWHVIVLVVVLLLVFGTKRLPDAARSLGQSARVLKSEMEGLKAESTSASTSETVTGETTSSSKEADGSAVHEDVTRTTAPS
jgi:sec-independent protein translocase protein TatA